MMQSENVCLRFTNFESDIKRFWQNLQIEENFHDVTLVCENKQIRSHKIVISFYSPVLGNMLKLNQNPHPLIYLRKVQHKDLTNLINFMYQGEVSIANKDLSNFLEVAEDLQIRGLSGGDTKCSYPQQKNPQHLNHEANISTPKRKRITENQSSPLESGEVYKQLDDNTIDDKVLVHEADILSEMVKQEKVEHNKQALPFTDEKRPKTEKQQNPNHNRNVNSPKGKRSIKNKILPIELSQEHDNSNDNEIDDQIFTLTVDDLSDLVKKEKFEHNNLVSKCEQKEFICKKCYKEFSNRGNLWTHVKSNHEGLRYSCEQCGKQFTKRADVKHHVDSIHQGKKYSCNQCSSQFTSKSNLTKHIVSTHDGILYSCNQCDRQFTDRGNLKQHIDSTHKGIRYPCNQCDHKSKDRSNLNKHLKKHWKAGVQR